MLGEDFLKSFNRVRLEPEHDGFVRKVILTFLVQVLSLFLSIGIAAIIARQLGPGGKGLLSVALLVPGMLGTFLNSGIGVANVYFTSSRRMDVATLTANSSTMAWIATTVGVVIISILWSMGWTEALVPGVPIGLVWLAAIGLPLGLLSGYFSAILQGLQQITTINAVNLSQMGLTLVLTLLFVVEFDLGVVGALVATLGGGVFAIAGMSYFLKRQGGSFALKWDSPIIHRTLSFGLRGHIGNMLQFINYRLDMFFVNYFLGPAGVGIYSVSVGIAELLWYLPNAIGFIVFPKAASTQPEVMNVFIPRIFSIALGLTALGAFGLIFFGKQIIHLLFSSSFNSAYFPLVALLPGAVLLGGAKILSNDIAGRGYPHYNSINSGVAAILTIILDLMLIPSYGVLGAALASSVAYGVIFLIALCFHRVVSRRTKGVLFA